MTTDLPPDPSEYSGHPPGSIDCSQAIGRMFVFLDNELETADQEQIRRHLEDCQPCLQKYDLERTVKTLVARSCCEKAPAGLRERVLLHVREVQIQINAEDPPSRD